MQHQAITTYHYMHVKDFAFVFAMFNMAKHIKYLLFTVYVDKTVDVNDFHIRIPNPRLTQTGVNDNISATVAIYLGFSRGSGFCE